MSHTTICRNIVIRDVSALKQAAAALKGKGINCKLLENEKPRMYSTGQAPVCDYVLNLSDGKYDVGFQKQKDGTYAPVLDTYQSHVSKQIGATCPMPYTAEGRAQHAIGQFMEEYSKAAVLNAAIQKGFFEESREVDQYGNTHITLSGM
jgi:hypothetical protein